MNIIISPRAEKQLRKIPKFDQIAVAKKIRGVASETALEAKLSGYADIYRVRVGNYRIVYQKGDGEIYIILIGHRKDIYKMLGEVLQ